MRSFARRWQPSRLVFQVVLSFVVTIEACSMMNLTNNRQHNLIGYRGIPT